MILLDLTIIFADDIPALVAEYEARQASLFTSWLELQRSPTAGRLVPVIERAASLAELLPIFPRYLN